MREPTDNYQAEGASATGRPEQQWPSPGYKFSPDELRVLAECNNESFFKRSMPIGTALGLGTFAAVQKGYLRPNARFGAFPKVTLAVMVGYFVGKLSYQDACAEKLMALPGSYIGQLLRDRKEGKIGGPRQTRSPTMFGAGPGDIYSDAGPGNSLDLDTERPLFNDDSYRPDQPEGLNKPTEPDPSKGLSSSYDELRRRNRGQYSEARQDPYKLDENAPPPISRPAKPQVPRAQTNKYGDVME